jgi:hypothetical protein
MFRLAVAFALAGLWLAASSALAGSMVSYSSGSETVSGYLALPEGTGRKPSICTAARWRRMPRRLTSWRAACPKTGRSAT